jgi:hypothetical protein
MCAAGFQPAVGGADRTLVARLTPDEDDELRRLYALAATGVPLSEATYARYVALRRRDRRRAVREPRGYATDGADAAPAAASAGAAAD